MATKRKSREEEVDKKKARIEEDRLSHLPVDLQVRILSFLDTKQAVQTSLLSKKWVSLWTCNPVLEFNDSAIHSLYAFDKFVTRVLCLRNPSAKLDRLIFIRRGTSSATILKKVFNYALSHGVKQLEANITKSRNRTWPINCLDTSFESLTHLVLQSGMSISCPFLGPSSGSFKNLTFLYLRGAIITHLEPFSGFPVLKKLTLLNCDINTECKTLSIHARNLSDLSISGYQSLNCCELTTPRLKNFKYRGYDFPLIRTHEGPLPVLDTVAIDFNGACNHLYEKRTFDDLLSLFCALSNATSLTLFSSTVYVLSFFQDELVKRRSPFRNLKCLKLDFRYLKYQNFFDRPWYLSFELSLQIPSDVKAYLLQNSPNVKVTATYPVPDFWDAEDLFLCLDIF